MKFATYPCTMKPRDGRLLLVSKDLRQACFTAPYGPTTMQELLDDWHKYQPLLEGVYLRLNQNQIDNAFLFDIDQCLAPLPRAYQWVDGSAYLYHVELVRKARNAEMPESFLTDPLMYQGASDHMLAPTQNTPQFDESWGIDFEGEVIIVTNDVPLGTKASAAHNHICLMGLVNDISLRNLIPGELAKGFGFVQSKPATTMAPLLLTLDELIPYYKHGTLHRKLYIWRNREQLGEANAGVDVQFNFYQLIEHAAKTRHLGPGTIIGSGTISNRDPEAGVSCLAELRMQEIIKTGQAITPFLRLGEHVKMEMYDDDNNTLFGAIHQRIGSPS